MIVREFLKEKNINEVLKKIKVKELVEYANKYIGEGLEVGNKYEYSSYRGNDIHNIITENIKKGLHELWQKYNIDYADMFDFIMISTWNIRVNISYENVGVWEDIGSYKFDTKRRKNASFDNKEFTLESIPKFELYDKLHNEVIVNYCSFDIENLTIYEFYIGLLEKARLNAITNLEKDIVEYKRKIAESKLQIEKIEDMIF